MRPILAFALLALYFGLAAGLRVVLHHRKTGATGVVGLAGPPGSLRWWAGVVFSLSGLVALSAPVFELGGLSHALWVSPLSVRAGVALALVATVGTLAAQTNMGASWRIGVRESERTELVTTGIFAFVRNPIFSLLLVGLAGVALVSPTPIMLAALALFLVAVELQVRLVEEPYLRRVHGSSYARYCADVGRFFPGLGRVRG
jgi:protein-S-isoprenylcysteine O-methyltransferase Ste14